MSLLFSLWGHQTLHCSLPGDLDVFSVCVCVIVNAGPPVCAGQKIAWFFFLTSLVPFPQGQTIQSEDKPISRPSPWE